METYTNEHVGWLVETLLILTLCVCVLYCLSSFRLAFFFPFSLFQRPPPPPETDAMALSSLSSVLVLLLPCLLLSLIPSCTPESQRDDEADVTPTPTPTAPESYDTLLSANSSSARCGKAVKCEPGIILPVWKPDDPGAGNKVVRAVVYFISLMYMFLGVSIIADRFMASIEVITSQVRGWNDC